MSGGSYDYIEHRFYDTAETLEVRHGNKPHVVALAALLREVGSIMHDIEWADSGDTALEKPQQPDLFQMRRADRAGGGEVSARDELMAAVAEELDHAYAKHGRDPWGRHEFYAILLEEVEELWEEIKADAPQEKVLAELRQVAAMCFRYAETGDRYRGGHPSIPRRVVRDQPKEGV